MFLRWYFLSTGTIHNSYHAKNTLFLRIWYALNAFTFHSSPVKTVVTIPFTCENLRPTSHVVYWDRITNCRQSVMIPALRDVVYAFQHSAPYITTWMKDHLQLHCSRLYAENRLRFDTMSNYHLHTGKIYSDDLQIFFSI